ncbi:MAG: hypothetical protein CMJ33_00235 [Phycisphaerae bacterium]|nr:hypothetical protein [Phycisphaerae bacterium]HAW96431.1 DUF3817 domain-containing protein [Phycisphaerales bacterium]
MTTAPDINRTYLICLIIAGLIEGTSTLLLFFIAMPLKYLYEAPQAVQILGPIHGWLFVMLVLMFLIGKWAVPISHKMMWAGMVGAILPFVPFYIDYRLAKLMPETTED